MRLPGSTRGFNRKVVGVVATFLMPRSIRTRLLLTLHANFVCSDRVFVEENKGDDEVFF